MHSWVMPFTIKSVFGIGLTLQQKFKYTTHMTNETITPITFEEMPKAMYLMMQKLNELSSKVDLLKGNAAPTPQDEWMNLKELCAYLPNHPAEQTVYGWTSTHQIPYHKRGKRIMFLKSEIDAWLNDGKVKSQAELAQEAARYISSKRKLLF